VDYSRRFIVKPGSRVRLRDSDAAITVGVDDKKEARKRLRKNVERLGELQYTLYAEDRRAVLVVLQAMDAGGKDGAIRKVFGPINPQGCRVTGFKAPTTEELAHDFLWRVHRAVPRRGEIGVFNRSHYEDVLIVRVRKLVPAPVWRKRYRQINDFERLLAESGVRILKFFLHISKGEQLERLRARLEDPTKHWKANPEDFEERKRWTQYLRAYEDAISRCTTAGAPWYVVPSDHKWFRDLVISGILVKEMAEMHLSCPEPKLDVSKIRLT